MSKTHQKSPPVIIPYEAWRITYQSSKQADEELAAAQRQLTPIDQREKEKVKDKAKDKVWEVIS